MCLSDIHSRRMASIQPTVKILTSGRSFATYRYFGVSYSPTMRCVTSEVKSYLCCAPICSACLANAVYRATELAGVLEVRVGIHKMQANLCIIGSRVLTLVSGGIDVQHKTTPRRGTAGSNAAGCGSEVMEAAGEGREGPLEPLFTSIARHER
jgi:hypothetical protein